jgi:hypothetical protein
MKIAPPQAPRYAVLFAANLLFALPAAKATPEQHDRMLDVSKGGTGVYANSLTIEIVGTPMFAANSVPPMAPKIPRPITPDDPQPRWVQIETTFDCSIPFNELTLKYHALLLVSEDPDRERRNRGEQVTGQKPPIKKYKLIEGETSLVDVMKGKARHASIYISPRTSQKLSDHPLDLTTFKYVWVEINDQSGKLIAQQLYKATSATKMEEVTQTATIVNELVAAGVTKDGTKVERASESMVNRNQTPFALLNWDYYEMLNPKK